ncbi:hypothetical protein ACFQUU_10555 [Herbaspirillum sp. GCM10030257]|uniref:hypothetical protein n=1 Tax=Herbaspirillum sp. GCM10030257 TaxID=3273393 RepID=UPI0036060C00
MLSLKAKNPACKAGPGSDVRFSCIWYGAWTLAPASWVLTFSNQIGAVKIIREINMLGNKGRNMEKLRSLRRKRQTVTTWIHAF